MRGYFNLGVNSVYLAVKIMRDWIYRLCTSRENVSGNEYMVVSMPARNATNCKLKHLRMFVLIIIVYIIGKKYKSFSLFIFSLSLD